MRTVGARVDLKLVLGEKVDLFGPQVPVDLRPQRHAVQPKIGVEHQVNDRRAVRAIAIEGLQVLRLVPGFARAAVIEDQFVAVYNWPLGAALAMLLLIIVMAALVFYLRAVNGEEGKRRG